MTTYKRYYQNGGCYFFTVAIANRQQSILTDNICLLRQAFQKVKLKHPFTINAIVILPDHIHCIWTMPVDSYDFSMRWRLIKSYFSQSLPNIEHRSKSRIRQHERGIWQRRFWEHFIDNQTDFNKHVDYVHYNPVKHGYCDNPQDWPYSSFHQFQKARSA